MIGSGVIMRNIEYWHHDEKIMIDYSWVMASFRGDAPVTKLAQHRRSAKYLFHTTAVRLALANGNGKEGDEMDHVKPSLSVPSTTNQVGRPENRKRKCVHRGQGTHVPLHVAHHRSEALCCFRCFCLRAPPTHEQVFILLRA